MSDVVQSFNHSKTIANFENAIFKVSLYDSNIIGKGQFVSETQVRSSIPSSSFTPKDIEGFQDSLRNIHEYNDEAKIDKGLGRLGKNPFTSATTKFFSGHVDTIVTKKILTPIASSVLNTSDDFKPLSFEEKIYNTNVVSLPLKSEVMCKL